MAESATVSFTLEGERHLFETAESFSLGHLNAQELLFTLKERIRVIPFGDYLRRYLYRATGMEGTFSEVPDDTYQQILLDAFHDSGTPASLTGQWLRLSTVTRRWLEQPTVRRDVVMLLGFGLSMQAEEVNLLLQSACHDHALDPDDPLEGICLHCYQRHYSFSRMSLLRSLLPEPEEKWESLLGIGTSGSSFLMQRTIHEDSALLKRLSVSTPPTPQALKIRAHFLSLYDRVCESIARETGKARAAVTCSDIERCFCPVTRLDSHGNMVMTLQPELRPYLEGRRLNRHRAYQLLHHQIEPSRYDLLNLLFYLRTEEDLQADSQKRLMHFLDQANPLLTECGYGPVYMADPYECLLMLSLLSEDPMGTYLDMLESAQKEYRES